MIKFFRIIRRNLLGEGKTGKYFKYGFGEVLLVCIGVLIALQVNNWNEKRKVQEAEHLLLEDLLNEMTTNLGFLEKAMEYNAKSKGAFNKLVHIYHNQYIPESTQEIDSLLSLAQWAWTFDPAMGALNAIKVSGHMNSVSNAELRKKIALYEDLARDAQEESQLLRQLIVDKYIPQLSQYVTLIDRLKFLGSDYEIMEGSKFPADYAGLFNDRSIENLLAYMHTWRVDELKEYNDLQNFIESFIETLKIELDD